MQNSCLFLYVCKLNRACNFSTFDGGLFSLERFDAQHPTKQIKLKECSRTFVNVAIVPSENYFEYLMFSI